MNANAQVDAKKALAAVQLSEERCKGCSLCVVICPKGCLNLDRSRFNDKGFHPATFTFQGGKGACIACGLCYMVCPDYAIHTVKRVKDMEA